MCTSLKVKSNTEIVQFPEKNLYTEFVKTAEWVKECPSTSTQYCSHHTPWQGCKAVWIFNPHIKENLAVVWASTQSWCGYIWASQIIFNFRSAIVAGVDATLSSSTELSNQGSVVVASQTLQSKQGSYAERQSLTYDYVTVFSTMGCWRLLMISLSKVSYRGLGLEWPLNGKCYQASYTANQSFWDWTKFL